jgi:hypothetical protein
MRGSRQCGTQSKIEVLLSTYEHSPATVQPHRSKPKSFPGALSQLRLNPSNGDISRSETSQLHKPALVGDVYAVLKKGQALKK